MHPADTRLATYGTLAPGKVNHHQLEGLNGNWSLETVRRRLLEEGWGAAHDCSGMVPDSDGDIVHVHVFESDDLPAHSVRLDAFEGREYRREIIAVSTPDGEVEASIYRVLALTG